MAHLPAMADMTQGPHAGHHRVEHGKQIAAKIVLREQGATAVLLGGSGGLGLEQGQHPPAESVQQIPVVQLVLSNRFALFGHALIKPEWLNLYSYNCVTNCYD